MKQFLKEHIWFFVFIVLLFFFGNRVPVLNFAIVPVFIFGFVYYGRQDLVILSLFTCFILADNLNYRFAFWNSLRFIFMILITFLTIVDLVRGKYRIKISFLLLFPFIISSFFSLNYSPATTQGFLKTLSYLLIFFVGFHYIHYHLVKENFKMAYSLFYLTLLMMIIGLFMIPVFPDLVFRIHNYKKRFQGFLGNPNGLGIFSSLLFCFYFVLYKTKNQLTNGIKLLGMAVVILCILLTGSRNALASILIFIVMFNGFRYQLLKYIFIFIIIPFGIYFTQFIDFKELVETLGLTKFLRMDSLTMAGGRVFAWDYAWKHFLEYPWVGRGFAYEEYLFDWDRIPHYLKMSGHVGGVHNSYLLFMLNSGVIGLFLILVFYFLFYLSLDNSKFKLPFFILVFVGAFFESWLCSSLNAYLITFLIITLFLSEYRQFITEGATKKNEQRQ